MIEDLFKRLHEAYDYDAERGWLINREKRSRMSVIGSRAGYDSVRGYRHIKIDGTVYVEHRMIWLYHHGSLPKIVDHIDCNRSNNRIENLRAASNGQNQQNARKSYRNKSGYKGVSFHKKSNKWIANIGFDGKKLYLGSFDSAEEASKAYNDAAILYHGEFARID